MQAMLLLLSPASLQPVVVEVVRAEGPHGAPVRLISPTPHRPLRAEGRVFSQEARCFSAHASLIPGDLLLGYAQPSSEEDQRQLDVCYSPFGHRALLQACQKLGTALEASSEGTLPIGFKSTPEEVNRVIEGLSKSQFKEAASTLLRSGTIKLSRDSIQLEEDAEWPDMFESLRAEAVEQEAIQAASAASDGSRATTVERCREIFVEGLPYSMTAHETMEHFETFGVVRGVRGAVAYPKGPDEPATFTGHAWVRFEEAAAADAALNAANGSIVGSRCLQVWSSGSRVAKQAARRQEHVDLPRSRRQRRQPDIRRQGRASTRQNTRPDEGTGRHVFVRGIPQGVRSPALINAFLECGDVVKVSWRRAAPDASFQCAVVEFASNDAARHAVHGMWRPPQVDGKQLFVHWDGYDRPRNQMRGGRGRGHRRPSERAAH